MDTRREFLRKASLLSGAAGLLNILPASVARAMAIDPAAGSTYLDAEHVVFLMQENRSFDHTFGTLQGVRGFNDPRAISTPGNKPVWFQTNEKGETYAPFRLDIKNTNATWMESLPHGWSDQVDARNNGKYDKWLDSKRSHVEQYKDMPLTMGYYSREDIPFYYSIADAFTVCDHHFCSSLTGTTANRLYFWTGTIREKQQAEILARVWNSDADNDTKVNWTTFPERLEDNGISWRIYQNEIGAGSSLQGEHEAWLSNFGDNPIEYFSQFRAGVPNDQLSGREKSLNEKAFTTNRKDPDYHELSTIKYTEDGRDREVRVPKGDILHQFREDVNQGKLPTVSWIVAPQQFSDHPSAAWYGAWYISEVLDILTKNPEVWKKTIFILTYDENDGYFDHVPPFVAPHPKDESTGRVSKGIDTSVEYVANAQQQSSQPEDVRTSAIGLGYRVPMVIASPWSRGGWVNSQVFDHTSSLLFLEKFLSAKFKKKIEEPNISEWRRTVCGDLTSVFRPYNGEKLKKPEFLERDEFVEAIHKAQFKNAPSNFKKVPEEDLRATPADISKLVPAQEKGIRDANAIPYELYADGKISGDQSKFVISLSCGNKIFGANSAGSPFTVYAPGVYHNEEVKCWSYAVRAGDRIDDGWTIADFAESRYHLRVYGPNGFFREFAGSANDPLVDVQVKYTGQQLAISLTNGAKQPVELRLRDNSYKGGEQVVQLAAGASKMIQRNVSSSFGWYDLSVSITGNERFISRYAGRIENGKPGKTDPFMGGVV